MNDRIFDNPYEDIPQSSNARDIDSHNGLLRQIHTVYLFCRDIRRVSQRVKEKKESLFMYESLESDGSEISETN